LARGVTSAQVCSNTTAHVKVSSHAELKIDVDWLHIHRIAVLQVSVAAIQWLLRSASLHCVGTMEAVESSPPSPSPHFNLFAHKPVELKRAQHLWQSDCLGVHTLAQALLWF
jgi:hypothetical protein